MMLNPSITPDFDKKYMLQALTDQKESWEIDSSFTTRFRTGYVSWIDVGGVSDRQMKGEQRTINLQNDFFWSMANNGIRFGEDTTNAYKYSNEAQAVFLNGSDGLYTIFDIAAPDIMITELWYDSMIEKLYQ